MDAERAFESLRDFLFFQAMRAYDRAVESGDYSYYREQGLDLDDLFSDYWDDIKYTFYEGYYALKDEVRGEPSIQAFAVRAATEFARMVRDESAMEVIFKLSRADRQLRRRIFDGEDWVQFGEFQSYSAGTKQRAIQEFG